jgi:hypothetical protein
VVEAGPYTLQPGAFLAGAGPRSIDGQGLLSAEWIGTNFSANTGVASDLAEDELITGYTLSKAYAGYVGHIAVAQVFAQPQFTVSMERALQSACVRLVAVDMRDAEAKAQDGHYFLSAR